MAKKTTGTTKKSTEASAKKPAANAAAKPEAKAQAKPASKPAAKPDAKPAAKKAAPAKKTTAKPLAKKAATEPAAKPAATPAVKKAAPTQKTVATPVAKKPVAKPAAKKQTATIEMRAEGNGRYTHSFVLLGPDNEQLARSELFVSHQGCANGIQEFRKALYRSSRIRKTQSAGQDFAFYVLIGAGLKVNSRIYYSDDERDDAVNKVREHGPIAKVVKRY
jgi:uncharacterized protein YegP (UPF0339 family)